MKRLLQLLICISLVSPLSAQWVKQTVPIGNTQVAYDVHAMTNMDIAVVGLEKVIRSNDGGNTWVNKTTISNVPFLTIHTGDTTWFSHSGSSQGWQVRLGKTAGNNVTLGSNPSNVYGNFMLNKTDGFVVGSNGMLRRTTDEGSSWSSNIPSGTTSFLRGIFFADAINGYAVGDNGTVSKTTTGGSTWGLVSTPISSRLNDAWFTSISTGYVAGDGGVILKTTNNGSSWIQQNSGVSNDIFDICFVDADTGYACGAFGMILKTINGGNTWWSTPTPTTHPINGIYFSDPTHGWAVGGKTGVEQIILTLAGPITPPCQTTAFFTPAMSMDICVGDTLDFNYIGFGATSFQWLENATPFSSSSDTTRVFSNVGPFDITLIAGDTTCIDTSMITLTVNANPSPSIVPNSAQMLCLGDTIVMLTNVFDTYLWSPNGDTTQSVNISMAGTYFVTATNADGCSANSDSVLVTVDTIPGSKFAASAVNTVVTFSDSTSANPTSWLWVFGDGDSSTVQNPTHTYPSVATYTVCLYATNFCGTDTLCESVDLSSIGVDPEWASQIKLYPNPVKDQLRIDHQGIELDQIEITDLYGRIILIEERDYLGTKNMDVSIFSAGIYFVRITAGGQMKSFKILKR